MKTLILILILGLLPTTALAANKQFLIPGYGYVDQKEQEEQWLIPGYGYIDEKPVPAAGARRIMMISQLIQKYEENITNFIILPLCNTSIRHNLLRGKNR